MDKANVRRWCIWAAEFHWNASHILMGAAGSMSAPQMPSAPYTWPAKPPERKLPYMDERTNWSSLSVPPGAPSGSPATPAQRPRVVIAGIVRLAVQSGLADWAARKISVRYQ